MTRYPDWQSRLHAFHRDHHNTPFAWGQWDCCLWVASAIEAMTGVDIAAKWRGTYSTSMGAEKACLTECGDRTVAAMVAHVAKLNNMPEVPPLFAQRGDMVLTSECLGLVALTGQHVIVLPESGLSLVDSSHIRRAWRV